MIIKSQKKENLSHQKTFKKESRQSNISERTDIPRMVKWNGQLELEQKSETVDLAPSLSTHMTNPLCTKGIYPRWQKGHLLQFNCSAILSAPSSHLCPFLQLFQEFHSGLTSTVKEFLCYWYITYCYWPFYINMYTYMYIHVYVNVCVYK